MDPYEIHDALRSGNVFLKDGTRIAHLEISDDVRFYHLTREAWTLLSRAGLLPWGV